MSSRAEHPKCRSADQMGLEVEGIVDSGVAGQGAVSASDRLVRRSAYAGCMARKSKAHDPFRWFDSSPR